MLLFSGFLFAMDQKTTAPSKIPDEKELSTPSAIKEYKKLKPVALPDFIVTDIYVSFVDNVCVLHYKIKNTGAKHTYRNIPVIIKDKDSIKLSTMAIANDLQNAGGEESYTFPIDLNKAPFKIGVNPNNSLKESDYNNNYLISKSELSCGDRLMATPPDFIITDIYAALDGENCYLFYKVKNNGGQNMYEEIGFFVIDKYVNSSNAHEAFPTGNLKKAGGQETFRSVGRIVPGGAPFTITVNPGSPNRLKESNYTNNTKTSATVLHCGDRLKPTLFKPQ
jgi:hypothetical protein